MTENLKKAIEAASTNEKLKAELAAIDVKTLEQDAVYDAFVEVMKKHGFSVSKEELMEADGITDKHEMDEQELESVTGGTIIRTMNMYSCDCKCAFGGGGSGDAYQKTCACVLYGQGQTTQLGKELWGFQIAMECSITGDGKWNGRDDNKLPF